MFFFNFAKRRRPAECKNERRPRHHNGPGVPVICLQTECHMEFMYGQLKLLPLSSMSRMSVSMGVLPTSRTKNSCSMTCELTVRRDGSLSSSLPNRIGWLGYCVRQYSSSAHCDFSCSDSMCATSDNPQASVK